MATLPLGSIPKDLNELTPEWLTAALSLSETLGAGQALTVKPAIGAKWHIAQTACVAVTYSPDTEPKPPERLFIKLAVFDDPFEVILPGEYAFYKRSLPAGMPVPACYGAYFDPESKLSCVILQDLSETHETTPWPHQLTANRCQIVVEALASFHGHNWYRPDENGGPTVERLIGNEAIMTGEFQKLLPPFLDALGDQLPDERLQMITRSLQCFPDLKAKRLREGRPTTIVHGDAHAWNAMFPKQQTQPASCVFVDWEDWRFDAAAADLAYMMALSWYPDRRTRLEQKLLRHYHNELLKKIETSYSWDDLLLDYRISLIQHVVVPLYVQQFKPQDVFWVEQLERWFMAMTDLQCEELL